MKVKSRKLTGVIIGVLICSGIFGGCANEKSLKEKAIHSVEEKQDEKIEAIENTVDKIDENSIGKISEIFPDKFYAENIANALQKNVDDYVSREELGGLGDCISPGEMSDLTGIGYLTGIEDFNCCKNEVRSVPSEIVNCKKLKSFDVCKAYSLSEIPVELFQCTDITYIRTLMSGVYELPKELGNLKKLKTLMCNNGTTLPIEIGDLSELEELMCENCYIPEEVKNLKNLEWVDLHGANVEDFIQHIGELKNLKSLDLGGCSLTEFPMGILELENLESLNLFGNDIRTIPKEIGNLEKLTSLNTYDNYNLDEDYKQYLNDNLRNK